MSVTTPQHRSTSRPLVLVALAAAAAAFMTACGDGGGGPPGDDPTPITERASRGRFQCGIGRGLTSHAPLQWMPWPVMATATSGTTYLARVESSSPDPFIPGQRDLTVSTFAPDGTLGQPTRVAPLDFDQYMFVAAAPRGDGVALVWLDVSTGSVSFAAFDAAGQVAVAPRVIATGPAGDFVPGNLRLAAGGDGGFAVVQRLSSATGGSELRMLTLNADGSTRGAPRVLATSTNVGAAKPEIAGEATGYALIWAEPGGSSGRVVFAMAGLDGSETIAPRPISLTDRARVGVGYQMALLAHGSGYLAAWTESDLGDPNTFSGASSVVRLVRLDASGARTGTPAPLRAATVDIDEIEPSLVAFGDAVAVLWGRGDHIYVCAGCIPDHRIDLLLVDPVDLVPLGDVVTISPVPVPPVTVGGGLLNRSVAVRGSSIFTAFNVTFHVHHTSASAAFACDE
jgi:hypothetical protein